MTRPFGTTAEVNVKALDELEKALKTKEAARKVVFDDYVSPFFKDAGDVCDDALNFYRSFQNAINELHGLKGRHEDKIMEKLEETKPHMDLLRQKMLTRRIALERRGNVLKSIRWVDDPALEAAISSLVDNVLMIFSGYDGIGSRPKTLIDALDLFERAADPPSVFATLGGVNPLIESAERNWSLACQIFEQIRVYATYGIHPKEWGIVSPIVVNRRLDLWFYARIIFGVVFLACAIISAITMIGSKLSNEYESLIKQQGK